MHQLDLPSHGFWKVQIADLLSDDDDDNDDDGGDDEPDDNDVDNNADNDGKRNKDNHYKDYNVKDYNMIFLVTFWYYRYHLHKSKDWVVSCIQDFSSTIFYSVWNWM